MGFLARLFGGPVLRNAIQSGDVKTLIEVLNASPELLSKRNNGGTLFFTVQQHMGDLLAAAQWGTGGS